MMVYRAEPGALGDWPLTTTMVFSIFVDETLIGPVYSDALVAGVDPLAV